MGQVFKAWNIRTDRPVAVKTIHKQMISNERAMERFRREMETAEQLDHPNICHVRDAGELDNRPFLVMELIDGIDLSRRVKTQGALPIHEAVEYARQAALGLQHAFERGIVHRDIKPANLMVTTIRYNDQPMAVVKILDFGLARYESEQDDNNRLTQVGKMLGTIDYVAPEQATDARNADIRADIYSLGCSLFYMLTGRPAFLGKDMVEKLGPRVTGEPPWIRTVNSEIPPGLEAVIRMMMARRPEDRYQTPIEAAQALEPFAAPPKVAVAQPVAGAPSAGVALATPVAPGAIAAGKVALAQPVYPTPLAAAPSPPTDPSEASFLEMTATGRDFTSGAAAKSPRDPSQRSSFPLKLVLILGGGFFLVSAAVCLGACLYGIFRPPDPPKGSIEITQTKYSKPSGMAEPGQNKLLVWIKRVDFKGDVKITLKDLPDGVTSSETVISKNENQKEIPFTVSFGVTPVTTQIKVVAECESPRIITEYPLEMKVGEPKKKK
jgi:serine/threonine protein kinase